VEEGQLCIVCWPARRWVLPLTGQVENAEVQKPKYGNGSTETKYGSEKKSNLLVSSALLTHDCAFLAKGDCLKVM